MFGKHQLLLLALAVSGLLPLSARAADESLQKHPNVLAVQVQARTSDTFDFDVTISSSACCFMIMLRNSRSRVTFTA